ncbi:30S ribosomal protein S8 [Patescibacteria group bacterium]|nr:30S ribosomal protein S8 [Patescibacteria group bacterium]
MTDPISDMLTRIRNALAVKKTEVILPYSKIKFGIAKVLEKEKWLKKIEVVSQGKDEKNFKQIKLILKYDDQDQPVIKTLKRISKPGQRVYVKKDRIPSVLQGLGMTILSTSKGLMTGQDARKKGLGGELICEIW